MEPKTRSRRKPLPEHLPREVVTYAAQANAVPAAAASCASSVKMSPSNWSTFPDSFKVIRHVRPKFACSGPERLVEAPAPIASDRKRGLAGPGLLAQVCWFRSLRINLPLYRQSEIYARQGVEIERSTLAGWVGGASDLLAPLIDAIQKRVLRWNSRCTPTIPPMPVLSPGSGKTMTGRLWTYVRDEQARGRRHRAGRLVRVLGGSQGGEHPRQPSEELPQGGHQAGRLRRLCCVISYVA